MGLSAEEILLRRGWTIADEGCWELKGCRFSNGYGQLKVGGSPKGAHRVAYEVWHGSIPEGYVVRHKCDNKPCVNPSHLETGTTQDNVNDRGFRNRTARGIKGRGVLSDEQVIEIRRRISPNPRKKNYAELAEEFGVCYSTIQRISLGVSYTHVDPHTGSVESN